MNEKSKVGVAITEVIIDEYQHAKVEKLQNVLRDIFDSMFEIMLQKGRGAA